MRNETLLALGLLIACTPVFAGSIYKCNTKEGVVFSQTPCAPDAVKLQTGKKRTAASAINGHDAGSIDAKLFDEIGAKSAQVIIDTVGPPAARYTHDGTEHWLYPNAVDLRDDQRVSPELLLENGTHFQTSWIPEDVMQDAVEVARGLANWQQPATPRPKSFTVGDTVVMGNSKSQVVGRLGEPDAKRVYRGREVWEYRDVPFAANNPRSLTIFLTFDGDIVTSSGGN